MKFDNKTNFYLLFILVFISNCIGQNEFSKLIDFHKPSKTESITTYVNYYDKENRNYVRKDSAIYDISYFDKSGFLKLYKFKFHNPDTSKYSYISYSGKYDTLNNKTHLYTHKQEDFSMNCIAYVLPPKKVKRKFRKYFLVEETNYYESRGDLVKKQYYYYNDESLKKVVVETPHSISVYTFYYKLRE